MATTTTTTTTYTVGSIKSSDLTSYLNKYETYLASACPDAITLLQDSLITTKTVTSESGTSLASTVVKLAKNEVGYAANGDNNKYAKELDTVNYFGWTSNGAAWCQIFVSWLFWSACNKDKSKTLSLTHQSSATAKCSTNYSGYSSAGAIYSTPEIGDQAFIHWTGSEIGHTALVVGVSDTDVTFVHGNTSNNTVKQNTYKLNSGIFAGFGRPDYDTVTSSEVATTTDTSYAGQIWNFLVALEYSAEATAGIMGNLKQESSYNPKAQQSNGVGCGLAQWDKTGRWQRVVKRANTLGVSPWTITPQMQVLVDEMGENKYGKEVDTTTIQKMKNECGYSSVADFKKVTDIETATKDFDTFFERSGTKVMEKRIKYAKEAYNTYA